MAARWQDDLARAARAALPAPAWEYLRTGAREEVSTGEAAAAWSAYRLWPRILRDVSSIDLSVTLLETTYALPCGIAPTSLQRCADPGGEVAMARAARAVGAPFVVPSNAGFPFADIGAAAGAWWLQAYLTEDRALWLPMLHAAADAGARAVVLTADAPQPGTKYAVDDDDWVGIDLSWHRCNYPDGLGTGQRGRWARNLGPQDIGWLRESLGLPVVVKGVLRPEDARRCVDAGAAAVWVSNHGGRQLDRSVATAVALPAVVAAVGRDAEVYVDGGLSSGLDVVTALALGARCAFLGRLPYLALAAGGTAEVSASLDRIRAETAEAMQLAGAADVRACGGLTAASEGDREGLPGSDLREPLM